MLNNTIDRIRLLFRKEKELYLALYDILGFYPHNITYYKVALMHKSLGHRATPEELKAFEGKGKKKGNNDDNGKNGKQNRKSNGNTRGDEKGGKRARLGKHLNNERLEFLGDAILDAVVGDVVYQHFPGKPEGFLTNTRSKLVQRETLGRLAKEMGVSKLILASGKSATHNCYIGGNAFEALVGAVYLDRGYKACYDFWTNRVMGRYLNMDKMAHKEVNFKSKILEWAQKNRVKIDFQLEEQSQDKNGSPIFAYSLVIEGIKGGTAEGFSKKESQQKACGITLKRLRTDSKFLDSIFAAKTERTKMEENPTTAVPEIEEPKKEDLFIEQRESNKKADTQQYTPETAERQKTTDRMQTELELDSMTLDDLKTTSGKETPEDIIARAEAEAYGETTTEK